MSEGGWSRQATAIVLLPKRMIGLRRMMDVWHKSIRQRPENVGRTLIARDSRHRWLTDGYIVNGQRWGGGVVVSLNVSRSNVSHLVLT